MGRIGSTLAVLLSGLTLAACSSDAPAPSPPAVAERDDATVEEPPLKQPLPAAHPTFQDPPVSAPQYRDQERNSIRYRGVRFDSRSHRLKVIDQTNGPGSRYADAAAAGRITRALAVVNGGFFTPKGEPLGLVISEGKPAGTWNSASSLGTGLWSEERGGYTSIHRRSERSRAAARSMRSLLQAGPLLIENGKPVRGLSNRKSSARSILLWDGGYRWWIGITSPCTLATLSRSLATSAPTSWSPEFTLNLDGGRSSELWVSSKLARKPLHHRPIWNRPVRNFLSLKER